MPHFLLLPFPLLFFPLFLNPPPFNWCFKGSRVYFSGCFFVGSWGPFPDCVFKGSWVLSLAVFLSFLFKALILHIVIVFFIYRSSSCWTGWSSLSISLLVCSSCTSAFTRDTPYTRKIKLQTTRWRILIDPAWRGSHQLLTGSALLLFIFTVSSSFSSWHLRGRDGGLESSEEILHNASDPFP